MALAFVNNRSFLTSTIVGVTSLEQLESDIDSINVRLSDDVIERIEEIHRQHPNPAP